MTAMRMAFCLLAVGALFFSACERSGDGKTHIQIWHQKTGPERDFFLAVLAAYNSTHPQVEVEALYHEPEEMRNLFIIAAVAGQGPDLIYGSADNVGVFVTTETIKPLDKVFAPEFFSQFTPEAVVEWSGARWLIGDQIGNHLALVYDRKKIAHAPETLAELIETARGLTKDFNGDGKMDEYGLTWNYREPFFFIPFLTAFGGWVMDDNGKPTLNNEATVQALQFILDLRDKYHFIPAEGDYEMADSLFKEHRTAMIINGPWSWAGYHVPEESLIAPLPKNEKTQLWCAPMYSARGYSINVNVPDAKLPLMRDLIDYLTSDSMQHDMAMRLLTSPVKKTVIASSDVQNDPTLQASLEQIRRAKVMPVRPELRQIWDGMRGAYQLVMNGAITARQGAAKMQNDCEKLISDSQL